jgi:hypothetical protein
MADDNLAFQPEPAAYESKLPSTVGDLIEVHEIHVDGTPSMEGLKPCYRRA